MYRKEKIEQLAQEYVNNGDENIFNNELLPELKWLAQVHLGKNYSSMKKDWKDMSQEVLYKIWINRSVLSFTRSKSLYQFLYGRIRRDLNRCAERIKDKEQRFQEYTNTVNDSRAEGFHTDVKDIVEYIEDLGEYNRDDS